MVAASVLYNADVTDTAAIITALGTNAASTLLIIPCGLNVLIMKQGS